MRVKEHVRCMSLVASLGAAMIAPTALADDFAPPPYRGQPASMVAKWEFATAPTNPYFISPDVFVLTVDPGNVPDEVPPHAEITSANWSWGPGDGNGEIYSYGGPGTVLPIAFKMPNWLPPHSMQEMRVQVTYSWPLGVPPGIFVNVESVERLWDKPPGGGTLISWPAAMVGGASPDNRHFYQDWIQVPAWHFTNLVIVLPWGVGLDEVVIDTHAIHAVHPNDMVASATPINEGLFDFSTLDADTDGPQLPQECDEGHGTGFIRDVWFQYEPTCDGTALITVCDPSTNYDTRLAVYTGDRANLNLIACNDDLPNCEVLGLAGYDLLSTVNVDVECDEVYWIRIGGYPGPSSTGSGTGKLLVLCSNGNPCPPGCPSDFDQNGMVDGADLAILLGAWGPCPTINCLGDLVVDGVVDGADLAVLLGDWGNC